MLLKTNLHFNNALIIAGIKLFQNFEAHTFDSLETLLTEMQFVLKKKIAGDSIHIYSSFFHKEEYTTLVFLNREDVIFKVRYLNTNIEVLF